MCLHKVFKYYACKHSGLNEVKVQLAGVCKKAEKSGKIPCDKLELAQCAVAKCDECLDPYSLFPKVTEEEVKRAEEEQAFFANRPKKPRRKASGKPKILNESNRIEKKPRRKYSRKTQTPDGTSGIEKQAGPRKQRTKEAESQGGLLVETNRRYNDHIMPQS